MLMGDFAKANGPKATLCARVRACAGLAFTRYFFTSRLYFYCTITLCANTPFIVQYIAQYYQLLHPPAPV